jgi:hypothetical protein
MTESWFKYMAGLLDADGSLSFQFAQTTTGNYGVYLRLVLVAAESVDRQGKFIKSLPYGSVVSTEAKGTWSKRNDWVVTKRTDIELLLPRIIKHMVIKGRHWQWMYDVWVEHRGKQVDSNGMERLKIACKASRAEAGPVRAKKHPTWAWVAGYIDGDGSLINEYDEDKKYQRMRVNVTAHSNDVIGLELLQKAFGGSIGDVKGTNIKRWWRNLGYQDSSFAIHFLRKLVRHSKLKKHKIELILSNHLQRLSVNTPTGEAIV